MKNISSATTLFYKLKYQKEVNFKLKKTIDNKFRVHLNAQYEIEKRLKEEIERLKTDYKNSLIKIKQNDLAFEELYKQYEKTDNLYKLEQQKKTPLFQKIKLWLKPN